MNIRNFKQHLQNVHGSLGNNSENKQMSDRLSEAHPQDVANYDKKMKEGDRSTTKPTTKAGQSLTPNSKSGKESLALEYFDVYFGDNLNESTSDEDIMEAVYDLIDLTDVVLSSVGLLDEEATWAETHGENQRKNRIARSVNSLSPVKTFHNKAKKSKREFDRLEKTRTAGTQVVTTADGPIKRIKNVEGSGPGETIIKGSWRGREGNPYSGGNPRPAPKPASTFTSKPETRPAPKPASTFTSKPETRPAPKPETFRGRPVTFSSKPKPKLAKKILQQGTPGKPGYIKLTPKNN